MLGIAGERLPVLELVQVGDDCQRTYWPPNERSTLAWKNLKVE